MGKGNWGKTGEINKRRRMMHDCDNCPEVGDCPLEEVARWARDHEDEMEVAKKESAEATVAACKAIVRDTPMQLFPGLAGRIAKEVFMIGYHKGRTYQEVPDTFKK